MSSDLCSTCCAASGGPACRCARAVELPTTTEADAEQPGEGTHITVRSVDVCAGCTTAEHPASDVSDATELADDGLAYDGMEDERREDVGLVGVGLRSAFVLAVALAAFVAVVTLATWLKGPSGHVASLPGPTFDSLDAMYGEDLQEANLSSGELRVTTVRVRDVSRFRFWTSKLPGVSNLETVPKLPASRRLPHNTARMDASERNALAYATNFVGAGPAEPAGAEVLMVVAESPSETAGLQTGDVIVSAQDGHDIYTISVFEHLLGVVADAEPGSTLLLGLHRDGADLEVPVVVSDDRTIGVVGATVFRNLPALSLDKFGVGGASAGSMMAVAFIDALSPGELVPQMSLAGSGTVTNMGDIGPVQGIAQKVKAAHRDGSTVFFVPDNEDLVSQAHANAPEGLEIVPVAHVTDMVIWLCDRGATDLVCDTFGTYRDAAGAEADVDVYEESS